MLAIIKTGGKQYKVKVGDKIKIEKLEAKEGEAIKFDEVLLIADPEGKEIKVGDPYLKDTAVEAKVLAQDRADKVMVIKFKNKVRYRRAYGHRQPFTKVEVTKIQ
jgi:large subunit ribosomal protein L21